MVTSRPYAQTNDVITSSSRADVRSSLPCDIDACAKASVFTLCYSRHGLCPAFASKRRIEAMKTLGNCSRIIQTCTVFFRQSVMLAWVKQTECAIRALLYYHHTLAFGQETCELTSKRRRAEANPMFATFTLKPYCKLSRAIIAASVRERRLKQSNSGLGCYPKRVLAFSRPNDKARQRHCAIVAKEQKRSVSQARGCGQYLRRKRPCDDRLLTYRQKALGVGQGIVWPYSAGAASKADRAAFSARSRASVKFSKARS